MTARWQAWVMLFLVGAAAGVQAMPAPVCVAVTNAIVDQRGVPLRGLDAAAEQFGLPWQPGDLVQVLQADGGVFPPLPDGRPSPSNAVIATGRIGTGVTPGDEGRGRFGLALNPRPAGTIAVRVFNAPTAAQATYYGDSQTFTVHDGDVFLATIAATDKALAADADGDGLNDAAEAALGADPTKNDTDGDGVSDGAEFAAGTGINDAASYLAVSRIAAAGTDVTVTWPSTADRSYQVEFTTNDLADAAAFAPVSERIVATTNEASFTVVGGAEAGRGHYRIRLLEDLP